MDLSTIFCTLDIRIHTRNKKRNSYDHKGCNSERDDDFDNSKSFLAGLRNERAICHVFLKKISTLCHETHFIVFSVNMNRIHLDTRGETLVSVIV